MTRRMMLGLVSGGCAYGQNTLLTTPPVRKPGDEYATLVNGKCSICIKLGLKSTVELGAYTTCTAMACGAGRYDEDGRFVPPPPCNTCTSGGLCSKGHKVQVNFPLGFIKMSPKAEEPK